MTTRPRPWAALRPRVTGTALGLALLVGAWGGGSLQILPTGATRPVTTAGNPTARPAHVHRTPAQLRAALLRAGDLPRPMTKLPSPTTAGPAAFSAASPSCTPLVELLNSDRRPGSRAAAKGTFAAEDGVLLDQTLDALGSAARAERLVSRYRNAVRSCSAVTLPSAGGESVLAAREVSMPQLGDDGFAARFSGRSGALRGFSALLVVSSTGDVVLGLTLLDGGEQEGVRTARAALDRVRLTLTDSTQRS